MPGSVGKVGVASLPRTDGTADVFLYILHRVAERQPVLVRRQPAQPLRDAPRPEPLHPAVQLVHELPDRGAAPVAGVVELLLERAEEALRPRVVAAHALAGHAAPEAVGLAPLDPRRRPVVHAPVVVHGGGLARRERRARRIKARVRELRGGAQAPRPADRPAVEAVDHVSVNLFFTSGTAVVILDRIHPTLPADPSPCGTAWGSCNPGRPLS